MAKQTINIGSAANDGTGDPIRTAFDKVNDNFDELYGAGFITSSSLPTAVSELTNDSGFITSSSLPTDVSELVNDSGFITNTTDHLILTGRYQLGTEVVFSNTSNTGLTDSIDTGLTIARDTGGGGIYNAESEIGYDQTDRDSPVGTLWNSDGFTNLDTVKNRYYTTFSEALKHAVGRNIVNAELIMHDTINDKYYTFVFSQWGIQGSGTFSYTRREIIIDDIGITFPDGTIQPTAWTGPIRRYDTVYVGPYSGHELIAEDAGHAIYFFNTHVILTSNTENTCEVGTFYTLIVGDTPGSLRVKQYADTTIIPTVETQIEPYSDEFTAEDYFLEANSIALLIKTDSNKWTLSPMGLQTSLKGSVYTANNVLLVDGDNGKIVGPVETASLSADEIFNADTIAGKLSGSDLDIISSGGINFRVDSENENNLFEFMNDGTFYTSKNIINDRSYISTPRNDAAGIMVITSANEVIITANEADAREWAFQADGTLKVAASTLVGNGGAIFSPDDGDLGIYGSTVNKSEDGNDIGIFGGVNLGSGNGGGVGIYGGVSSGGTGGNVSIIAGQGNVANGRVDIGTLSTSEIYIGANNAQTFINGDVDFSGSIITGTNFLTSVSINDITDVTITSPTNGQVLKYNGSIWVNAADNEGAGIAGIELTDLDVSVANTSGGGNLEYDNTSGIFTYTPPDLSVYATTASLATVATSGAYTDLTGAPTIPADVSDLTDTTNLLSPPARTTVSETTASIADTATDNIDITGFKSYALMAIQTDGAAWVRIYANAASRTADAGRLETTDPTPDAGVIAEVITTGAETVLISPAAIGFNFESTVTNVIPAAVTNKTGGTTTITVTLTILQMES